MCPVSQVVLATGVGEHHSVVGEDSIVATLLARMQRMPPAKWTANIALLAWLELANISDNCIESFRERRIEGQMLVELYEGDAADVWRELAGHTQALDSHRYRLAYKRHTQALKRHTQSGTQAPHAVSSTEAAASKNQDVGCIADGDGQSLVRTSSKDRLLTRLKSHTIWVCELLAILNIISTWRMIAMLIVRARTAQVGGIESDACTVKGVKAELESLGPISSVIPRPKAKGKSWALVRCRQHFSST